MSEYSTLLEDVINGIDLSQEDAEDVMDRIMNGEWDDAQIGGFLTALRIKGETSGEIAGFASGMRSHALAFKLDSEMRPVVDTCGTGGDSVDTINISTLSALVASAAGVRVAKHGNRSVSSKCGSADLLEALDVQLELDPEEVKTCIERTKIGFMYAPAFHRAMKHAIGPRKSLGVRTVFNLLGPLTNPADADRQLLGVFSDKWVRPMAEALRSLGVERAMVVHGTDGLDEISLSAETLYAELRNGDVTEGVFSPADFGLETIDIQDLEGGGIETNKQITIDLLEGRASDPVENIIAANAGAVIYLADRAGTLKEAVRVAKDVIRSGDARERLNKLVRFTSEPVGLK